MSNPYVEQLMEKGFSRWETYRPATEKTFPCVIGSRRFETQEEYDEALHDFLNSN